MNNEFLATQFQRLINRFGQKAFDSEFVQLATREVIGMNQESLRRFVDVMIGSRKHTDPPRMAEFREAAHAELKRRFDEDVRGAARVFANEPMPTLLKRLGYTGCKTLVEAVEVQRLRNRIARERGENA